MTEQSLPRPPEPEDPFRDPKLSSQWPGFGTLFPWPFSARETGLVLGWLSAAGLVVAGVATWSTGGALLVAGILLAAIVTLVLAEVL